MMGHRLGLDKVIPRQVSCICTRMSSRVLSLGPCVWTDIAIMSDFYFAGFPGNCSSSLRVSPQFWGHCSQLLFFSPGCRHSSGVTGVISGGHWSHLKLSAIVHLTKTWYILKNVRFGQSRTNRMRCRFLGLFWMLSTSCGALRVASFHCVYHIIE